MAFNLVRFSQQDPQWKNTVIGGGPDTIGYIGCALTSVTMLVSSWGYSETPQSLNKKLTGIGGFINEAIVWSKVSQLYPQVQFTGLSLSPNGSAALSQLDASLAAGQLVVVEVDYSPDPGLQTHWVLVYGKLDNDYLIQDPWPYPAETNQVTLMSRFSQGQPLDHAIKAIAFYQCSAGGTPAPSTTPSGGTTTTPTTPSIPSSSQPPVQTDLYVQAIPTATAGLRLHIQPSADSPANYAEMPGTQLNVIEDKAGALAKIGLTNQWIYIRDPQGNQGYVAAWFVQQSTVAPAPASTPPTPSTPTPSTPVPASSQPSRFQVSVIDAVGAGGLRLRQMPSLGGALVGIEMAGKILTVLERPDRAQAKIGVVGQWINVRDPNGLRGYVAAQYVQLVS